MGFHDSKGIWRDLAECYNLTLAELKRLATANHQQGERVALSILPTASSNGLLGMYKYHATSVLTADDLFVIKPDDGVGRYLLCEGFPFDLAIPITFNLADAAVIATLPTNGVALLGRSYWEVTADWTGGASSTIGLSSGQAPHNTKGDLLGGAAGDLAATLVASAGKLLGTVGADVAGGILLKSAATIRYDEITSAFTAGTGYAHVVGTMLANPGA